MSNQKKHPPCQAPFACDKCPSMPRLQQRPKANHRKSRHESKRPMSPRSRKPEIPMKGSSHPSPSLAENWRFNITLRSWLVHVLNAKQLGRFACFGFVILSLGTRPPSQDLLLLQVLDDDNKTIVMQRPLSLIQYLPPKPLWSHRRKTRPFQKTQPNATTIECLTNT